jgi:hypothetical protein
MAEAWWGTLAAAKGSAARVPGLHWRSKVIDLGKSRVLCWVCQEEAELYSAAMHADSAAVYE